MNSINELFCVRIGEQIRGFIHDNLWGKLYRERKYVESSLMYDIDRKTEKQIFKKVVIEIMIPIRRSLRNEFDGLD